MRFIFFLLSLLSSLPLHGKSIQVITLDSLCKEVYVVRGYVEYFVDTTGTRTAAEMREMKGFERVKDGVKDFTNENVAFTYWIRFSIVNKEPGAIYRLEMFDYDIDEVSLYRLTKDGIEEAHSGYSRQFIQRDLYHKNIGFVMSLPEKDTVTCLMRFKSHKINVLEPVIRSLPSFYKYSIVEYLLLGVFYGFTCIIIVYNLVYFVILRKVNYLYYLIYMSSITLYLMCRNGTGFQFFWPENPAVNFWLGIVSCTIGISALLLFTSTYLNLKTTSTAKHKVLVALAVVNFGMIPLQLSFDSSLFHQLIFISILHVAFIVSIPAWQSGYADKWFVLGFILLDLGFVITWLEHIHILPSSIITVYGLYFCIDLQFIAISISLAQGIRQLANEKNKALVKLLNTSEKNETLRILALKKQMSPHFIFNALNSILQRILSGNKEEASTHLVQFSKLIRKTMEQSDVLYSNLSDELELLKLYLSMEAVRLGQTFIYSIEVSPEVDESQELVPSFVLQPFVENSIWHGLMVKEGPKNIWVKVRKEKKGVKIVIEDNGIGREKASANKKLHGSKSQGIELIMERIQLLNRKYQTQSSIEIIDLYHSDATPKGTQVILTTGYIHEQLFENHYH